MAWRIGNNVIKGVLDNRQKGLIVGSIWLSGSASPITLELHGNFLRDLAGCELFFENPQALQGEPPPLDPVQIGMTGDMTASRKITLVDAPRERAPAPFGRNREFQQRLANALYLEWFSETNGRVVIESTGFVINFSAPAWTMTAEEEEAQLAANRESFRDWLEHLSEMEEEEDILSDAGQRPLNEFEWEKRFKDSDRKNERLGEVLEKYHGHPDSEKLIAREMGWTWVEEELEAQERGVFAEVDQAELDPFEDEEALLEDELREPNPLREGMDWVRDADGSVEHPLAQRALQFSNGLWKEFEEGGLLGETGDSRVFEWAGLVESAAVRLSNTLGDVAYGEDVEEGFLVAGLKRSVHSIHQALDMLQKLEPANVIPIDRARQAQKTLFELREEVIAMMAHYRSA